jgi:putative thioredoxin
MTEASEAPVGAQRFAGSNMPDLGKGKAADAAAGPGGPAGAPVAGPGGTPSGTPSGTPAAGGAGGFVTEIGSEAEFAALVRQSTTVPVLVDLWATWCGPCQQLSPVLEKLAGEYGGRFLLAKVDVDANPGIAAAFQVQSVPTVMALVGGQAMPLFQGAAPEAQIRQVLDALLQAAAQQGVAGTVDPAGAAPAEPPLPPLHQEAFDAIERGDLAAAQAAYTKALAEAPGDAAAKAGLAQVELLLRLEANDGGPKVGLDAVLAAADAAVAGGDPADGFARLIAALRGAAPDDKEKLRLRLLDLFEVVGAGDPAVAKARRDLASALF